MPEPKLTIITEISHPHDHALGEHRQVGLAADRTTLAKRRWRGTADDGREFGFDLGDALSHGTHFFTDGASRYVLRQTPEEVIEIPVDSIAQAARVAWGLGNLHFGVQVLEQAIRVVEDPAVLQFLSREHITFQRVSAVFLPLAAGASHHHGHDHHPHG